MNILSLGIVLNIHDDRGENVNYLHISTCRQLGASGFAAIPELQESRPGVLLELVVSKSIILSPYLTACRVTVLTHISINL